MSKQEGSPPAPSFPRTLFMAANFDHFTVEDADAYADQVWRLPAPPDGSTEPPSPRLFYRVRPPILAALFNRLQAARLAAVAGTLPWARVQAAEARFLPEAYAWLDEAKRFLGDDLVTGEMERAFDAAAGSSALPPQACSWKELEGGASAFQTVETTRGMATATKAI